MMKNITAIKLRIVLVATLLLLGVAAGGIFMVGYGQVRDYASEVQKTASDASASNSSLQDLIATKKTLAANSVIVDKAAQLASESQQYLYQDQIINDINQYASEAGLSITNISFADTVTTSVGSAPAAATSPAAASGTTTTPDGVSGSGAAAAAPAGVKSIEATISLRNPIHYNQMLTFLHLVEQSLFRMQISHISLSGSSSDPGSDEVTSDSLTIEVYVR